jgi:hypothetical protein
MTLASSFLISTDPFHRPMTISSKHRFGGGFGRSERRECIEHAAEQDRIDAETRVRSEAAVAQADGFRSDFLEDVRRVISSVAPAAKKQEMLIALQRHYRDRFIGLDS